VLAAYCEVCGTQLVPTKDYKHWFCPRCRKIVEGTNVGPYV